MAGHSGAEGIELESIRVDAGSQAARLAPGEQESDREAGQDRIFTLRDFAGASKIMFGGRLVCGPRGGSLHWTLILVMIPGVIWLAFLSPGYWRQVKRCSRGTAASQPQLQSDFDTERNVRH